MAIVILSITNKCNKYLLPSFSLLFLLSSTLVTIEPNLSFSFPSLSSF